MYSVTVSLLIESIDYNNFKKHLDYYEDVMLIMGIFTFTVIDYPNLLYILMLHVYQCNGNIVYPVSLY